MQGHVYGFRTLKGWSHVHGAAPGVWIRELRGVQYISLPLCGVESKVCSKKGEGGGVRCTASES